ncbi:pentapeptide repeat-containing protein [Desulfovibrio oxyclinae]|uniref:pentapeptide repeat-containing protein n=1 Tax=Desulfovibrio oxyclinae TaxID=63560 RepID=UPI00036EE166|nr:pentapeptide repeat-containing protein [Desulfovibrio oxyclinae]
MCEEYKWDDPQEPILCLLEDRKEYCLFHAPGDLKDHEALMDAAWERVNCVLEANVGRGENDQISCDLSGTAFGEDVDFGGMVFSTSDFRDAKFGGEADFMNATFGGKANFRNATFGGKADLWYAKFGGEANFRCAKFGGKAYFWNAKFGGKAYFRNAKFGGEAYFWNTKFGGKAYFMNATFEGEANFWYPEFGRKAYFRNATFGGETSFRNAEFGGKTYFGNATFGEKANFWYAKFRGEAYFTNATFGGEANFRYAKFESEAQFLLSTFSSFMIADKTAFEDKTLFEKATFQKNASFSQTTFKEVSFPLSRFYEEPVFDRADLRMAELLGAPVEDFRLMACKLPTRRGRRITYDARKVNGIGYFPLDNVNTVSTLEETPPPGHLEDLYRRLKKVARREYDETLASDFHYAEKEMQRHRGWDMLTNCERTRENNHGFCLRDRARGLGLWLVLSLYRFISGYGESPLRAFGALMLLVLLPGALMHPLPVHLPLWLAIIGLMAFPKGFFLPFWLGAASLWFLPHIPNSLENLDLGASWLHFIPLVKLPKAAEFDWLPRALMLCSQVAITLQAALFGFALRNRFRR